ncbi:MAG: hypothetical protein Q8R92_19795 [Deltaproteobacteria bacterium]|nr:hypothetical protein [Deltaproteobacteria bacterium]
MKRIIAFVFTMLCALSAFAVDGSSVQASDGQGTVITLTLDVCGNPAILDKIKEINPDIVARGGEPLDANNFHSGALLYQGTSYGACWTMVGDDVVGILADADERGVLSMFVPGTAFRSTRGI